MRFLYAVVCAVILSMGLGMTPVFAHHVVGHGGAALSFFNPYSSQTRPPETFLDFNFSVDHLDGGLGYVLTYQFIGEYSVTRRISVGGRVPVLSIREKFLQQTDSLGDVVLSVKGLVGEWPLYRAFLNVGTDVAFPTGSETKGTGSGNVMFSPYVTLSRGFRPFALLFSLGSTLAASDQVYPSVDYGTSLVVPIAKGALPVDVFLSFQGSTVTTSETLANGSTKAYLKPAVVFHLRPKFLTTIGAKVSVIDTLEVKPGTALSPQSTVLLSDIDTGFIFDINYSF